MENRKTKEFNRKDYLKEHIAAFLQSYSKGLNQVSGCLNAINNTKSIDEQDTEKRNILEKCLALFRSLKFRALIEREKEKNGILDQGAVTKETLMENLHKISELSQDITDRLSEVIFGDLKRKYNMAPKASTGMLNTITTTQGTVKKDVNLDTIKNPLPPVPFQDIFGNKISIQHIGTLTYTTLSSDEYIYQYHVSKSLGDNPPTTFDVFSNIDLNQLKEDSEYCQVVLQELLSRNNIELSNADGYIGEISNTTGSQQQLKIGEEKDLPGFYRYQVSSKYALEYNGERIEAIKAYNQQQAKEDNDREI